MAVETVAVRSKRPMVKVLLAMSRSPESRDYAMSHVDYDQARALDTMREVFPTIDEDIQGKRVIDFGCGKGYQAVGYVLAGAESAVGVEIIDSLVEQSRARVAQFGVGDKVWITTDLNEGIQGDIIVSQNSFEHFTDPEGTLRMLKRSLAPGGRIYISFGPPWYSPTGAHMGFFCTVPWVQLMFSEKTILEARSYFRSDGARSWAEAGLGEMSIAKFERVVRDSGLKMSSVRYDCIKGMDFLRRLPVARELFINRVSCILTA